MVYVIAQLKLESYDKWKPVFDERAAIRKESGSKEARLFRNSNDQNEAVIIFEWDNNGKRKKVHGISNSTKNSTRSRYEKTKSYLP